MEYAEDQLEGTSNGSKQVFMKTGEDAVEAKTVKYEETATDEKDGVHKEMQIVKEKNRCFAHTTDSEEHEEQIAGEIEKCMKDLDTNFLHDDTKTGTRVDAGETKIENEMLQNEADHVKRNYDFQIMKEDNEWCRERRAGECKSRGKNAGDEEGDDSRKSVANQLDFMYQQEILPDSMNHKFDDEVNKGKVTQEPGIKGEISYDIGEVGITTRLCMKLERGTDRSTLVLPAVLTQIVDSSPEMCSATSSVLYQSVQSEVQQCSSISTNRVLSACSDSCLELLNTSGPSYNSSPNLSVSSICCSYCTSCSSVPFLSSCCYTATEEADATSNSAIVREVVHRRKRLANGDILKFSGMTLIPGKPRKWRKVRRRVGNTFAHIWEVMNETKDALFAEMQNLVARGLIGHRRTGRITRANPCSWTSSSLGNLQSSAPSTSQIVAPPLITSHLLTSSPSLMPLSSPTTPLACNSLQGNRLLAAETQQCNIIPWSQPLSSSQPDGNQSIAEIGTAILSSG